MAWIATRSGFLKRVASTSTATRALSVSGLDRRWFHVEREFVDQYADKKEPFGFNGLGELVFYRTYARQKPNGGRERWLETVERVVNGTFSMQHRWMDQQGLVWDEQVAQARAQNMFARMFDMKFLPPGRGLWAMGTAVTEKRGLFAALNNCAFVSTENLATEFAEPFCFMMDAAMLGVGVGFDTKGTGTMTVHAPQAFGDGGVNYLVPDSREGWVESLRLLLNSYTQPGMGYVKMDYSIVRPAGTPIRGFGGESSGPDPLIELHEATRLVLDRLDGKPLSVTAIVDIMNMIGRCVVSGNVRRTAEIAFGDAESEEYINLKNYNVNPHRAAFGWTSNNSVFARLGMDYTNVARNVELNGEPGFAWLDNMRNYGRMNGVKDDSDYRASGGNPCLEQTLESYELCCLVETFPDKHDSMEDFLETLDTAILYAKTVTLGHTHWPKSNQVMLRNRRIGCSVSGVSQFIANRGLEELRLWTESGYDRVQAFDNKISEEFAVPRSIKTTCVKPSGTVSLLAGSTPGMHAPEARFYVRRVRVAKTSQVIEPLKRANFPLEPAEMDPENTIVVSIPIDAGKGVRTGKDVSMWEQLSLAAFLQRHWADNQVSCTVTFDPETEGKLLPHALDYFQYQLKGVSFLPRLEAGAYAQMPYEEITEEEYHKMMATIGELDLSELSKAHEESVVTDQFSAFQIDEGVHVGNSPDNGQGIPDSYCEGGICEVPTVPPTRK